MLIATLAKFFLVADDAFTFHALPERALHHNQSMSERNSEKMILVITTTIPHLDLALNIYYKSTFLYRISFKPQDNTGIKLGKGILSHLTIVETRKTQRAGTEISIFLISNSLLFAQYKPKKSTHLEKLLGIELDSEHLFARLLGKQNSNFPPG